MEIEKEIEENLNAIAKLKKAIPLGIITMVLFSFIFPLMLFRKKFDLINDFFGYPLLVIILVVLSNSLYLFSYNIAITKRRTNIARLEALLKKGKK
jgi:hypothetical protein